MTYGFMKRTNPLFMFLNEVVSTVRRAWGPTDYIATTEWGQLNIEYGESEEGEYADIAFMLPDRLYAVIDDGTYGQLAAIRIFRDDTE